MITAVLLWNCIFLPELSLYKCIEFRAHGTRYNIRCASKHDSCCTAVTAYVKTNIFIEDKTGKFYMRHCKNRDRNLYFTYNYTIHESIRM